MRWRRLAGPARRAGRAPAAVQQVGRGDDEQPQPRHIIDQCLPRRQCFGQQRAHRDDRRLGPCPRRFQPIAPGDRARPPAIVAAHRLHEVARRQPQIDTAAVRRLHMAERPVHQRRQFIGIGGFEHRQPGLAHGDQGRVDALVRTAFGRQRQPGRGGDQQETRILVATIVQRIEPARDERIIDRADRQQPRAEQGRRQPGCCQHEEQIILGNAEFEVLAGAVAAPFLRRRDLGGAEHIGQLAAPEQPARVDPGAKVGRHRDVGRGGDDAVGKRSAGLGDIEQDAPEGRLGRLFVALGRGNRRHRHQLKGLVTRQPRRRRCRHKGLQRAALVVADTGPGLPFVAFGNAQRLAQSRHLRGVHLAGVIVLVPGERQALALDGIGNDQRRPVARGGFGIGGKQRGDAMAAQIGHQPRQFIIVAPCQQRRQPAFAADIGGQPCPPGGAALIGQRGEFDIGAIVDPGFERGTTGFGKGSLLAAAVLDGDHPPAAGFEDVVETPEHAVGGGMVEALAVVVDDPPAVADVVLVAFDQAFVDVALVKLGIAHQRDHPPGIGQGKAAMGDEIVLNQRGKGGDGHPQPDAAGGKINRNRVLGAAGIALRAVQGAECHQLLAILRPQQIVDGVEQRPGVRLHRHPVIGAERGEVEAGHDRRHRRAARLMAADLDAVTAGAQMIGMVDRPGRQPA